MTEQEQKEAYLADLGYILQENGTYRNIHTEEQELSLEDAYEKEVKDEK